MSLNDFFTMIKFFGTCLATISSFYFILYVCYLATLDFIKSIKVWCVLMWIKRRCKIAKHDGNFCFGKNYYSVDFYPFEFENKLISYNNFIQKITPNTTLTGLSLDKYDIKQILEDLEKAQQIHYSTVVKTPRGYARLFFENNILLKEFLDKNTINETKNN